MGSFVIFLPLMMMMIMMWTEPVHNHLRFFNARTFKSGESVDDFIPNMARLSVFQSPPGGLNTSV